MFNCYVDLHINHQRNCALGKRRIPSESPGGLMTAFLAVVSYLVGALATRDTPAQATDASPPAPGPHFETPREAIRSAFKRAGWEPERVRQVLVSTSDTSCDVYVYVDLSGHSEQEACEVISAAIPALPFTVIDVRPPASDPKA